MLSCAKASNSSYWKEVEAGITLKANTIGVSNIIVRYHVDESELDNQSKLLDYLGQFKCKSLIIAPNLLFTDKIAKSLKENGINIVVIDRATDASVDAIIKTDNYLAGASAAEKMAKAIGKGGKVGIFRFSKSVPSTSLRAQGFKDTAIELGLIISEDIVLGTTVGEVRLNYKK